MPNAISHTAHPRTANLAAFAGTIPGRILIALAASAVVAAAARVSFPLPFTPVPLTMQPFAVLGVGLALGPVDGFFALLAYLAEGAMGLPVFTPAGPGGMAQLLGASGGFLMAYPLVAAIVGFVTRALSTRMSRFSAALIGGSLATTVLFLSGAIWFAHFMHLSLYATWLGGVAPFLPGEAVKVLVAAGLYSTLNRAKLNA